MSQNIILLYGGGGAEHEVSQVSVQYLKTTLEKTSNYQLHLVEWGKDGVLRLENGEEVEITAAKKLKHKNDGSEIDLHAAVPCIHGYPGETGDIQAWFDMIKLPYLGVGPEASKLCFNKISTKLWMNALGVPNTPFVFINFPGASEEARKFQAKHGTVFVKAAKQGSSIGCYPASNYQELDKAIHDAFQFSDYVLVERSLRGCREFEVSVYEWNGKIVATPPGEIITPTNTFYDYNEKYSQQSQTKTQVRAEGVTVYDVKEIQELATRLFQGLHLRHLSRIDLFYCREGELFINEINTFPGMTPISLFPKMMEANGHSFSEFLNQKLAEILG